MKKVYLLLIAFVLLISCGGQKTDDAKNAAATDGEQISKTFEGDFVYFADSAVFTDYATSSNFQVATEGEYLNLEREFTSFNFAEPTKVNLKVEGYLEERPGMEEGTTATYLIVTKIIGFDTNRTTSLF